MAKGAERCFREDELATFFQEEKKFNTTWEAIRSHDSVMALLDQSISISPAHRRGARLGLDALAAIIQG